MKRKIIFAISAIANCLTLQFMPFMILTSCGKLEKADDNNCKLSVISENDSVMLYMKELPSADKFTPGITEIWYKNTITGDSGVIVKSNPEIFGTGKPSVGDHNISAFKSSIDSIPSILHCYAQPYSDYIIVEGPTCHAGIIATYEINWKTKECTLLPSNNGFVGFANWSDDIIVSSKYCDIDPDLVLWYEVFYAVSPDGAVVDSMSTINQVIEDALPWIHREAGLKMNNIKLLSHKKLYPHVNDSSFWGNRFECKYRELEESQITSLDSLVKVDTKWTKTSNRYYYYDEEFNPKGDPYNPEPYGMFTIIEINKQDKTGIIRKGAFSNPKSIPQN